MIYINKHENTFDEGSFEVFGKDNGYLTKGNPVRKYLDTPSGSKYYISYDVMFLSGSTNNNFFTPYGSNGMCFSNYTKGQNTITLETSGGNTVKSLNISRNKWYNVYEVFDYEEGKVEMYLTSGNDSSSNSGFFASTTSVNKEAIQYIELKLSGVAIRNLVISDKEFPLGSEVVELPLEISSEWNKDSEAYYTEETDKKITIKSSVPNGYTVYGNNLVLTGIKSGDISAISINGNNYDVSHLKTLITELDNISSIEIKGETE